MLSKELPASIVLWDLLAEGDESLLQVPFGTRRERLVRALATREPPVFLTPATTDRALASKWFHEFEGAGLDGIMAKPLTGTYQPNKRVMYKVKHLRTCDAVVAGRSSSRFSRRSARAPPRPTRG
jgi:ATP-dependent DNA ligase